MKYLVGKTTNGTAVFAVKGAEAVNLTALDASVGQDLMALIADPALSESLASKIDGAPTVAVALSVCLAALHIATVRRRGSPHVSHVGIARRRRDCPKSRRRRCEEARVPPMLSPGLDSAEGTGLSGVCSCSNMGGGSTGCANP